MERDLGDIAEQVLDRGDVRLCFQDLGAERTGGLKPLPPRKALRWPTA